MRNLLRKLKRPFCRHNWQAINTPLTYTYFYACTKCTKVESVGRDEVNGFKHLRKLGGDTFEEVAKQ